MNNTLKITAAAALSTLALLFTACAPQGENMAAEPLPTQTPAQGISWPAGQAFPHFAAPAQTLDGFTVADPRLTPTERNLFVTLQGLVNRKQPRLFLYEAEREGRDKWPRLLGLQIEERPYERRWELVKKYRDEVEGVVLYDTEKSPHYINLATTAAGLKNALPVTRPEYDSLTRTGVTLPILEDLTALPYTHPSEIYQYLYDRYWPACTRRLVVSQNPRNGYIRDLGVAAGAAIVWLDPRRHNENTVLRRFLADMQPGESILTGWWAEERSGIGIVTEYGLSTVPSDYYENATVYAGMPHTIALPEVPRMPALENKIYLAVFLSDGDNIQYCQHAMSMLWDDPHRGIIPINWTVSPALADLGPGLLNHFYATATPNDFLASGPSGLGYSLIYDSHNRVWNTTSGETLAPYTRQTQRYLERCGLRVITIWDELNSEQMQAYADNCRYLYGVTQEDWLFHDPVLSHIKSDRLAFIPNMPCYASNVEYIRDKWRDTITAYDSRKPLFLAAQGESWKMGPDQIARLKAMLEEFAPAPIEICRGDHFFALYNRAHGLYFNLALAPETRVTSGPSAADATRAADGSPSGAHIWIASAKEENCIEFDFGATYELGRYVVRHASAGGLSPELDIRSFSLETSADGVDWRTADRQTAPAEVTDVDIAPVAARYARLRILEPGSDGIARIGDIEIYGRTR